MSFDTFDPQDVAAFEGKFAIRGPAIEKVPVNGGVGSPGDGQDEVNLDVDTVRAIAPRAKILDFEATNGEAGFAEMMNAIVADGRSKIVSISWGRCDLRLPPGVRNADEAAFSAAAAAGVTTYVAAGDEGAYDCQSHDLADQRLSVDWPSAGANVVAVGGTRLSVRGDGTYLEEFGWENILAGVGGGGGLASETQRPAWQTGVSGIDNRESNGRRQIPDVSGPADPASGLNVMSKGRFQASVGGTSAAAPFWGAITALVHGYAKQQGARRPGFMGPLLYRAAARFPKAFHDVTKGGNRHFNAAPGWDYATGLGSPDATELAKAVVSLVGR
jgi:kumamolisin